MKTCIVFAGPPALGKSTMIRKVGADLGDFFVYSTDDMITSMALTEGKTYDEFFSFDSMKAAEKHAGADLATAIVEGRNVIWDQTNTGVKKRAKILTRMKQAGYRVECIAFVPPSAENLEDVKAWCARLEYRSKSEGKTIPVSVMEQMLSNYVLPTPEEGFDNLRFVDMWGKEFE